jgi:ABC-type transport system involved in multi-copper enzyme maturation permease subunit
MMYANVIARKELLQNLLNGRVLTTLVLGLTLILTTVVILMGDYEHQLRDYQSRVQRQDQFIDAYGHYNRLGWMSRQMRPPSYLQVLVLGIDQEARQENFVSNPVAAMLSRLDFGGIVTVIFSLIAVLFSYDAISGEREEGVLRQLLAAGAGRRAIIFGKYTGGLIALLVPFTIAALGGFVAVAVRPIIQLSGQDFAVFGLLLLLSWITLAVFFGIGLFFSARSRSSGESVLKSLFVWVIFVLIIPNISPYIAAEFLPTPSAAKLEQEQQRLGDRERDDILHSRARALLAQFPTLGEVVELPRGALEARLASSPELHERYEAYIKQYEALVRQVNAEQQEKIRKVSETFDRRAAAQRELAMTLTLLSPSSNFTLAATEATETGIASEEYWRKQAGEASRQLNGYAEARYRKELEKNPAYNSNDYLDLRERPRFHYRTSPFSERFSATLPRLGVLTVLTLLFFVGAYFSFLTYDVR